MATLPIKSILQQTEYSQHHGQMGKAATGATFKLGNLISQDANGEFVETAVGAPAAAAKNKLAAHDSGRFERKQDYVDSTGTMVFDPYEIVRYLSQFLVLEPGDLINTGTPPGVGMGFDPPVWLRPGDVMELGIDGLGSQRQRVVAAR